jgi:hypothetical protein
MITKLKSDFRDYYDHAFAGNMMPADYVFNRMSANEIDRKSQFDILKNDFIIPMMIVRHGIVKDWDTKIYRELVVVYVDLLSHRGEGKILTTIEDAKEKYPDCLCSKYWGGHNMIAKSTRHLQIGNRAWNLTYTGYGSWMSNNAPVIDIGNIYEVKPFEQECGNKYYAMFAIDFVFKMAVDFNTSPGLKGTGIEEHIKSLQIYQYFDEFVVKVGAENIYVLEKDE